MRYAAGSNSLRSHVEHPEPGPPWTATAGLPRGSPLVSQYIRLPSPTSSMPCSYGSISGYRPSTLALLIFYRATPAPIVHVHDVFENIPPTGSRGPRVCRRAKQGPDPAVLWG